MLQMLELMFWTANVTQCAARGSLGRVLGSGCDAVGGSLREVLGSGCDAAGWERQFNEGFEKCM